jgi:para-nitrobenzyl esterase
MMSYWAEFAHTGSPGRGRRGELPEWTAWDESSPVSPRYLVLDTPAGGGLRLASRTYTVEGVIADLLADPRFATARDRCAVLRNLTEMDFASRADYDSASACAALAYDAWPWPDVAAAH